MGYGADTEKIPEIPKIPKIPKAPDYAGPSTSPDPGPDWIDNRRIGLPCGRRRAGDVTDGGTTVEAQTST